jgi:fluoride exporter
VARTLTPRRRLLAVMAGGFLGAIARYLLSLFVQSHLGKAWPYDILLINITGALALAFVTTLADATFLIGPTRRLFINVGFLGAYTTFSSLALGDILLFVGGKWLPALLYLFLSLIGGVLAVFLGDWLGQRVVGWRRQRSLYMGVKKQKVAKIKQAKRLLK